MTSCGPRADDILWRFTTPERIREVWTRTDGRRWRSNLEAVLLPWTPGPRPGSPKEMALARVLQLHGLGRPVRQHCLTDPATGKRRYLDLAYVAERVAPEYDGRLTHGPRQWAHDADREDWLAKAGWIRLPAGPAQLIEPGATEYCDTVRRALDERRAGYLA